jgi:hypothetical protein
VWDDVNRFFEQEVAPLFDNPSAHVLTLIWFGIALFLFVLVVTVVFTFIRYVSESAVLQMVDKYEQDNTKLGFKQGWKLGWSRKAFRMWVIDLVISLPVMLFVAAVVGLGILFFVSVMNGEYTAAIAGSIVAIGCAFVFFLAFAAVMVFLGLLRQFFVRAAALDGSRVGESFRNGWKMFKRNWKSAALMWLVMFGIGIGFGIGSMIIFFLLIPVYAILLIPALLVAAIPGLIVFGIASLFSSWVLAAILAAIFALPLFFTILFSPLILLNAWYKIYESSVWTLTYREMKVLESLQPVLEVPPAEGDA